MDYQSAFYVLFALAVLAAAGGVWVTQRKNKRIQKFEEREELRQRGRLAFRDVVAGLRQEGLELVHEGYSDEDKIVVSRRRKLASSAELKVDLIESGTQVVLKAYVEFPVLPISQLRRQYRLEHSIEDKLRQALPSTRIADKPADFDWKLLGAQIGRDIKAYQEAWEEIRDDIPKVHTLIIKNEEKQRDLRTKHEVELKILDQEFEQELNRYKALHPSGVV